MIVSQLDIRLIATRQGTTMSAPTTTPTAPEVMDDVLARHFDAEARHDMDDLLGTLTDDVDHDVVGWPTGPTKGHEELRPNYEQLFADLQATGVTPLRRLYGDSFCVDEVMYDAIATGHPFGVEGRDRPVSVRLLHICEFEDGRISRENVWLDAATLFQQLAD